MKIVYVIPLFLIFGTAFAQTDPLSGVPHQVMNGVQDYYHTLLEKLGSGPNNDGSLSQVGNQTIGVIDDTVKTTKQVKQLVGSIFGYISLRFFGHDLPSWFVPLLVTITLGLTLLGLWKHLLKVLITAAIIGVVIFIFLLLGGQFF